MKLSMWIINNDLSEKYTTIPLIVNGERTIESVRLFSYDGIPSGSGRNLYIGVFSDFFKSDCTPRVLLASNYDLIIVEQATVLDIMNDIVLIFDKYREFENKLKVASSSPNMFQDVLDVIHELFKCPMLFGQKDLRILALTKQYTDEQVYDGWEEVKKFYTMPTKLINSSVAPDMMKYPESIKTVAIPVTKNEHKHFRYQIRSNVYCNNRLWGHLYIYYHKDTVPMSVIQLARYCADIYGYLLDNLVTKDTKSKNNVYAYLSDLLDGKPLDDEKLHIIKWQLDLQPGQKLRLYKIIINKSGYNEVFFDYLLVTIRSSQNKIVFPYDDSIVAIAIDSSSKLTNSILLTCQQTLPDDMYVCGISYPFEDLQSINCAYFQAGYSIKMKRRWGKPEGNHVYYDDYAFAGLVGYIKESINYKAFILPQLIELYHNDVQNGTEYYKTLFWLLVNNLRFVETAKQLYIHRNTLKYRVDKITQFLKVDIYDDDIRAYLRLCYALILDEYPLNDNVSCEMSTHATNKSEIPSKS